MNKAELTLPTDTEILVTREFDAPREHVWRAWTEPDLVSRWWPGRRGKMVSCEIDLRVGGAWRYVMEATGGFEVAFHGTYLDLDAPARLVNTELFEGAPEPSEAPVNEISFEAVDGRTLLTMRTIVESRALRDMIVGSGMEAGMQEGLDLLEELATEAARASAAR
jgi:uncharacterized protein YndB with AHSA1/START domain